MHWYKYVDSNQFVIIFLRTLQIKDVQKEDKGFYMCQVNTDPMVSTVGFLDVVGE